MTPTHTHTHTHTHMRIHTNTHLIKREKMSFSIWCPAEASMHLIPNDIVTDLLKRYLHMIEICSSTVQVSKRFQNLSHCALGQVRTVTLLPKCNMGNMKLRTGFVRMLSKFGKSIKSILGREHMEQTFTVKQQRYKKKKHPGYHLAFFLSALIFFFDWVFT